MPWTAKSGTTYKLIQLDTNIISEILKNGSTKKIFFLKFDPSRYAVCFTIYNVIELRRRKDIFDLFIEFFSLYPSFILKPHKQIITEELIYGKIKYESVLLNAFSKFGEHKSYDFKFFINHLFNDTEIKKAESEWRKDEQKIIESWVSMKKNFRTTSESTNSRDSNRYLNEAGIQSLIQQFPNWVKFELDAGRIPKIDQFPSLKIMLYSQYYRLFEENRTLDIQDVTDIRIMATTPYMDSIVTEKFQAEIFKKVKKLWNQIENLEVFTLKDLRS